MQGAEPCIPSEQHVDVPKSGIELRALEEALMHRLPSFYRTAYRFLGNPADAEDAVQDGVLSAYQHIGEFRGESQISTWLTAIVSNCARMQLRKRRQRVHVSLEERTSEDQEYSMLERLTDERASPEDECLENELKARLRTFAAQLSPVLRRTFQLRELEGLSVRETANTLGMPEGTVKAQLSRARRKLARSMLKGQGM
jgi:RNA polymerase sigma-70 factor, ECF subfamily